MAYYNLTKHTQRMRQLITGFQRDTHTPDNDVEVADLAIYDSIA